MAENYSKTRNARALDVILRSKAGLGLSRSFVTAMRQYKDAPGLYIISTPEQFLYVGQSRTLGIRVRQSLIARLFPVRPVDKPYAFDQTVQYRVSLIPKVDAVDRRALEAYAIRHLQPALNSVDEAEFYEPFSPLDLFEGIQSYAVWQSDQPTPPAEGRRRRGRRPRPTVDASAADAPDGGH